MEKLTVAFIGRSGSGKGTQAMMLASFLEKKHPQVQVFYHETGKRFRDFITGGSHTAKLSKKIMDEGGLQPTFLAIWLWAESFVEGFRGNEHVIIDGTPRYLDEARVLAQAMSFYGRELSLLNIEISEEEARKRLLKRGREDDTEEEITKRLAWFSESVTPAIDYYKGHNDHNLVHINGEQTVEAIHEEIKEKLGLQ